MRVLLVEDELRLARSIRAGLEEEGFQVDIEANGLDGEVRARSGLYDLLVVDWRLPGQDGPTLLAHLRADGIGLPALLLTALTTVESRVAGLDAGADDYLGKPFAFEELLARLRALLRRSSAAAGPLLVRHGALRLDLRPKEFALLERLASRATEVVSRSEIVDAVWGDPFVSENALDVTVSGLRTRLAEAASTRPGDGVAEIETIRGVGYRLTAR